MKPRSAISIPRRNHGAGLPLGALFVFSFCIVLSCPARSAEPCDRLELLSSRPVPELTAKFHQDSGWTGSDGAYSIHLAGGKTLWLFGDTYIGTIQGGKRLNPHFINNSAALQSLGDEEAPLRFYWGEEGGKPRALLVPPEKECWLWPGDGAFIDGSLYLFYKLISRLPEGREGFNFDWTGDRLYKISNPLDVQAWKHRSVLLSRKGGPHLGTACLVDDGYLYIYGLERSGSASERKTIVARIPCRDLPVLGLENLEYWSREGTWSKEPSPLGTLFDTGATEMSVCRVPGIDGFIATYTPGGLGPLIAVRHAPSPEGPWSPPLTVYHCPEGASKLFVYGAKAHPEFSREKGRLIITYCRNAGSLEEDCLHPEIYVPQAIEIKLSCGGKEKAWRIDQSVMN
jgi:hypothetical protein